jgi:ATP-dependent RNA helicase DeaD
MNSPQDSTENPSAANPAEAAEAAITFASLGLAAPVLEALLAVGYESPSPIQAATIPALLEGKDVLGQAQTGTGKTAAFALPLLSGLDLNVAGVQALVMVPTRELAIQVAEAFNKYAAKMPGFHVLPIYGGQSYTPQLNALRRGVHVVVGTPGRIMDHLDRGTLSLEAVRYVVLDEADEMLQMGFVDAIEQILGKVPPERQVALFSATMAPQIKRIAKTHLRSPREINIQGKTTTSANIRQRYWVVSGLHKLDALTRILEVEPFDAMLVFTRTKQSTVELAERLEARGFSAAALNGDILQAQRERTIAALKAGKIDILVATDVAARGLDVERIGHVVNFDVPYDTESYVHRIGRTGRAGRSGEAILFIAPRERGMLRAIERATNQPIEPMELPSVATINEVRMDKFKQQITETLESSDLTLFRKLVEDYEQALNVPAIEIAAALAKMARGDVPLLLEPPKREQRKPMEFDLREARDKRSAREPRFERDTRGERPERPFREKKERAPRDAEAGMESYRIEVGYEHGVKPGNIVGAIANEAGLDAKHMGRIEIFDDYSIVDLPEGMPKEILKHLKTVWCAGQQLRITKDGTVPDTAPKKPRPPRRPDTREKPDTVGKVKRKNESFFEFRQGKKKNKFAE